MQPHSGKEGRMPSDARQDMRTYLTDNGITHSVSSEATSQIVPQEALTVHKKRNNTNRQTISASSSPALVKGSAALDHGVHAMNASPPTPAFHQNDSSHSTKGQTTASDPASALGTSKTRGMEEGRMVRTLSGIWSNLSGPVSRMSRSGSSSKGDVDIDGYGETLDPDDPNLTGAQANRVDEKQAMKRSIWARTKSFAGIARPRMPKRLSTAVITRHVEGATQIERHCE